MNKIIIISAIALMLASCKSENGKNEWYSEIRSADKLVLASMTISKMATIDDMTFAEANGIRQRADAILSSLKLGDRVAAYSYDTHLRAFIDLSQLKPEDIQVDEEAKTLTISLPPVQTEFAGRDIGLREEHYRVTGLRSHINSKERAELKEKMNELLKQEIENDPTFKNILIDRAKNKARIYFNSLFEGSGYTPTVIFSTNVINKND